ncbi:MAG: hypothetical protein HFI32_02250 [Lachnospiraceae bacterium]|nr:hypothetical protein [Lachnospiraceae bacterium]
MKGQKREEQRRIRKGSGAVLAFFIGSGFASGQEILQFFGAYGTGKGALGLCLSLFFVYLCVYRILLDGGKRQNMRASELLNWYCGPYLGALLEWLTPFFLFLCYSVMLAGSGALLGEYLGLQVQTGRLLMLALSLGTVLLGLNRLTEIIGRIGPVIVALVFGLGLACVLRQGGMPLVSAAEARQAGILPTAESWILSAFLYAGFTVLTALPFLTGLGKSLSSGKERSRCAFYGCGIYWAGAMLLLLGLLASLEEIGGKGVPTVYLAEQLVPGAGLVFAAVMFAGIYTTAVPMLWSVGSRLASEEHRGRFSLACMAVAGGAFLWSRMDFSFLVGTVYPYIGYFGLAIVVCILRKGIHTRSKRGISAGKVFTGGFSQWPPHTWR